MSTISALSTRSFVPDQAAPSNAGTSTGIDDPLTNKQTFLRLLVAQLQNQNPLNPSDPMQYITQLTQFSELEQALGTRTELEGIHKTLEGMTKLPPAAP